jgi:hypothetical protein
MAGQAQNSRSKNSFVDGCLLRPAFKKLAKHYALPLGLFP